jgi:hypothetical protein
MCIEIYNEKWESYMRTEQALVTELSTVITKNKNLNIKIGNFMTRLIDNGYILKENKWVKREE